MEHSSLQLRVISGRDIKAFNFFQKISVYAVVSILSDEPKKKEQQKKKGYMQRQKTPVDRGGGRNPEWNHTMQIDLKSIPLHDSGIISHLFLRFQLCCEGLGFGNRTIGEVHVPFKDLIDEFNGTVRYVSYQVRTKDRKPNGVLNFSYKVNGNAKNKETDHLVPEKIHHPSLDDLHKQSCLFPEKVHYPTVDIPHNESPDILCYPSLVEIQPHSPPPAMGSPKLYYCPSPAQEFYNMSTPQSPSPAFQVMYDPAMASHNFYCCPSPAQEFYIMSTPQSPSPAFSVKPGSYVHPFAPSQAHGPGPFGHSSESMVHSYGFHGY